MAERQSMKRHGFLVGLVMLIFFVISFLTNILGPLIPDVIRSFSLSLTLAALLPFSFFIAYGVMSIPAGMLVERIQEKRTMMVSFIVAFGGALAFSLVPRFAVALPSLFAIGIGMAMLQVAINPLLRVAGGEEHFAFNSVLAQLVFGLASFLSPYVYTYLVTNLQRPQANQGILLSALASVVPTALPWVSLYWVFAVITLLMVFVLGLSRFPQIDRKEDERAGAWATHRTLFRNRTVVLYFIGIFAYTGTEQGTSNWISQFLATYHGFDPHTVGASAVSWFWGMMTIGCVLGLFLLKLFDSRRILRWFVGAAIVFLTAALFGPAPLARVAFPAMGFAASVMWSIIFSLALNSVDRHHGSFSGILCTAIIGGAIVPLVIGWLGDHLGLRAGMCLLYGTLAYIFGISVWARPLIANKTIDFGERKERL
jgi:FHS family L-fucose permease-like MFS transporter